MSLITFNFETGYLIEPVIDVLGILVNAGLAVYITSVIQKSNEDRGRFKDYVIDELRKIIYDLDSLKNDLQSVNISPQEFNRQIKSISVNQKYIIRLLESDFGMSSSQYRDRFYDLKKCVTDLQSFQSSWKSSSKIQLTNREFSIVIDAFNFCKEELSASIRRVTLNNLVKK